MPSPKYPGFFVCIYSCGLLFFLFILGGCSSRTVPLSEITLDGNKEAALRLTRFTARPGIDTADMDVHLRWKYLGQGGTIDAMLVLQLPDHARMTVLDPLGRSAFIISSNGTTFTMVDNRSGKGYRGKVDSRWWRRYVPEALKPDFLVYLLGAMLPEKGLQYDFAGIDEKGRYWYQFEEIKKTGENLLHRIMLNEEGLAEQYLLLDTRSQILVRFTYRQYLFIDDSDRQGVEKVWPGVVIVDGEEIQGEFFLEVKKMVSNERLPSSFFTLDIPAHYDIEVLSH